MSDAFDELALPIEPQQPTQRFADDLRARLLRAATPVVALPEPAVPERNNSMPQTITPYLCVHDANAALDWYRAYFRASVSNVIPWEGRVGHSELEFGGAVFYLSDEAPTLGVLSPRTMGDGASTSFVVHVADADAFIERAVAGGAVLERAVEEAHGTRSGWIRDPFGHRWNIGTPLVDRMAAAAKRRPAEPYYMTLTSPDVERAAVFYNAVLDWQLSEANDGGGRHVHNTRMPIGVRPPDMQFGHTDAGQIDMWWLVRDFDDAVDRVRVAGGTVLSVTGYDSGREAICEDDQGVQFRLSEPAPGYDPEP
jgi:uncharacterized glyoxalase superfamily protein PhnB